MINVSSQPEIKKTIKSKIVFNEKGNFEEEMWKSNVNKDSSKEDFIAFGEAVFNEFIPNFNATDKFTIKKYKNCAVFSLLPFITKAVIWYYNKELYVGNISLNESGKF